MIFVNPVKLFCLTMQNYNKIVLYLVTSSKKVTFIKHF